MFDDGTQPSILTVAEVARYLRVSDTTVWRWCSSGKLPAFRLGRGWRVRRHDLTVLIQHAEPHDDNPVAYRERTEVSCSPSGSDAEE